MQAMMNEYNAHAASHTYALGFVTGGKLINVMLSWAEISKYFKLDRASSSKGGMRKIRIRLAKTDRWVLANHPTAQVLGEEADLMQDSTHNRGENYERIVTEKLAGQTWKKDSIPFWVAGDVTINGEQIQIKLDGAELTNEKTLAKAPWHN